MREDAAAPGPEAVGSSPQKRLADKKREEAVGKRRPRPRQLIPTTVPVAAGGFASLGACFHYSASVGACACGLVATATLVAWPMWRPLADLCSSLLSTRSRDVPGRLEEARLSVCHRSAAAHRLP